MPFLDQKWDPEAFLVSKRVSQRNLGSPQGGSEGPLGLLGCGEVMRGRFWGDFGRPIAPPRGPSGAPSGAKRDPFAPQGGLRSSQGSP